MDSNAGSILRACILPAPNNKSQLASNESQQSSIMATGDLTCGKTPSWSGKSKRALWGRDDGTIWTATRCMRLLRPIRVQINALRHRNTTPDKSSKKTRHQMEEEAKRWTIDAELGVTALMDRGLRIGSDANDLDFVPSEVIERVLPYRTSRRIVRKFSLRQNRRPPKLIVAHDRSHSADPDRLAQIAICEQLVSQAYEIFRCKIEDPNFRGLGGEHVETQETIAARASYTAKIRTGRPPFESHDKLFRAFDDLIKATTKPPREDQSVESLHGCQTVRRPLLDTRQLNLFQSCLRSIPNVIAQRQQSMLDEGHDREDCKLVDEEVYSQLEDYSVAPTGGGWRPLRLVVRSHGLHLLCEAIREGVVLPNAIKAHMDSCVVRNFAEGPRQIMRAWGDGVASGKISTSMPRAAACEMRKVSQEFGLERHVWDWLADALSSRDTQIDLVKEMLYLWVHCVYSLAAIDARERESAIRLLEKIVSCTLGAQHFDADAATNQIRLSSQGTSNIDVQTAISKTSRTQCKDTMEMAPILSTIVAFLTTIAQQQNRLSAHATTALQRICVHVERILTLTGIEHLDEFQTTVALIPFVSMSALLSYGNAGMNMPEAQKVFFQKTVCQGLSNEVYVCLTKHLMKVAHDISHGMGAYSLKYHMQTMTRYLVDLSKENENATSFLAKLAVKTAESFAEHYPKKSNVSFALELENSAGLNISEESDEDNHDQNASRDQHKPGNSGLQSQRSRFRFEDSISEWVQRTPEQRSLGHSLHVLIPPTISPNPDGKEGPQPVKVLINHASKASTGSDLTDTEVFPSSAEASSPSKAFTFSIICPPHRSSSETMSDSDDDATLIGSEPPGSPTPSIASRILSTAVVGEDKVNAVSVNNETSNLKAAVRVILPPVSIETKQAVETYERERGRSDLTIAVETMCTTGKKRSFEPDTSPQSPESACFENTKRSRLKKFPLLSPLSTNSGSDGDWLPVGVSCPRVGRLRRSSRRTSLRSNASSTKKSLFERLMMDDSEDELAL